MTTTENLPTDTADIAAEIGRLTEIIDWAQANGFGDTVTLAHERQLILRGER